MGDARFFQDEPSTSDVVKAAEQNRRSWIEELFSRPKNATPDSAPNGGNGGPADQDPTSSKPSPPPNDFGIDPYTVLPKSKNPYGRFPDDPRTLIPQFKDPCGPFPAEPPSNLDREVPEFKNPDGSTGGIEPGETGKAKSCKEGSQIDNKEQPKKLPMPLRERWSRGGSHHYLRNHTTNPIN